jgi:hypothetical protein
MTKAERLERVARLLTEHADAPAPDLGDVAWDGDVPLLDATVAGLASTYVGGRVELRGDQRRIALGCARDLTDLATRLGGDERAYAERLRAMALLVGGSETVV